MTRRSAAARVALWASGILLTVVVLAAIGAVGVPLLARPTTDAWGATPAERTMPLPGDEFVPAPRVASTRAVTIDASPALVYKLLVQIGYKRGGWYGWDWFYRLTGADEFLGGHSARKVVPELQTLRPDDLVALNDQNAYRVTELSQAGEAKPGWMLLEQATGPGTKPGSIEQSPSTTDTSWSWFVYPGPAGGTRLVVRKRTGGASRGAFRDWLDANTLDLGEAILARRTLTGIRRVAESLSASSGSK